MSAHVEEVDTDDEMPTLEEPGKEVAPAPAPEAAPAVDMLGQEVKASSGKQSRTEKKARKQMKSLGMKQLTGINRVTVKKAKNILFVISSPDVFKSPASDTYIIFGDAKIEDINSQAAAAAAQQFKAPEEEGDDDMPSLVDADEDDDNVDTTGLDQDEIDTIMQQTSCSKARAVSALRKHQHVVDAILSIDSN